MKVVAILHALLLLAICVLWCAAFRPGTVVPCWSDAECHDLNPGLCAADEPYCFERDK